MVVILLRVGVYGDKRVTMKHLVRFFVILSVLVTYQIDALRAPAEAKPNGCSMGGAGTPKGKGPTKKKMPSCLVLDSIDPAPSGIGQIVAVTYAVTGRIGTPTGSVTVSNGEVNCTGSVADGQCSLAFTTAGLKKLVVTYNGDAKYNQSEDTGYHTVNKGQSNTTIVTDDPDASNPGQSVAVVYTVVAELLGGGTPTGTVTVSDGVDRCSASVAKGQCRRRWPSAVARKTNSAHNHFGPRRGSKLSREVNNV